MKYNAKTIAILPSTLCNIYPKQNKKLCEEILKNQGLILTEYLFEPKNSFEQINRFIQRDRLEAMLANSIMLIASNSIGQGDSGSRHAMEKAMAYNKKTFVMYNSKTDEQNPLFDLNRYYLNKGAKIITKNLIKKSTYH